MSSPVSSGPGWLYAALRGGVRPRTVALLAARRARRRWESALSIVYAPSPERAAWSGPARSGRLPSQHLPDHVRANWADDAAEPHVTVVAAVGERGTPATWLPLAALTSLKVILTSLKESM